jgi:alpha-beta hydrolase superfamily lysophospholipase
MRPADPRYCDEPVSGGERLDASIDYVVFCWSVLDPLARYQHMKATGDERLVRNTEAYFRNPDELHEGNPTLLLRRGEKVRMPPALLLQGTKDDNIPLVVPNGFIEAYRGAGGEIEAHFYEGMPHRFMLEVPGPEMEDAIARLKAFIGRQIGSRSAVA